MTAPGYRAPDGPHWVKDAEPGLQCRDGRGVVWQVIAVEQGGRVLRWVSSDWTRRATTEAAPTHPDYPSDAAVLAANRAEKKRQAQWRA